MTPVKSFRNGCSNLVSLMKHYFNEKISEKYRSRSKKYVDASQQHHHQKQKNKVIKAIETATTSSTKTTTTNFPEDVLPQVKSMEDNNTNDNYLPQQQLQQEMDTNATTILYKTTINDLPEDVLYQILSRFPTKTVVQCKSVSKDWKAVLSSYSSALSFDKHHDAQCWEFAVVKEPKASLFEDQLGELKITMNFIFSLYYSNLDPRIKLVASLDPDDFQEQCLLKNCAIIPFDFRPVLCATHNGLLLFDITIKRVKSGASRTFCICNPLTNQCVVFPPFKPEHLNGSTYSFGLICRRSSNKKNGELETSYRVLGVPHKSETNMVQIFSSEIGQWSHAFMSSSQGCFMLLPGKNVVYKEMIFWSKMGGGFVGFDPFNIDDHGYCPTCIIDFPNYMHFFKQTYVPTPCVSFGWMSSLVRGTVGVCQGRLRVSNVINRYKEEENRPRRRYGYPSLEVLELKEEDEKENISGSNKWVKVQEVDLDSIICNRSTQSISDYIEETDDVNVVVLAFHPIEGDIVFLWLNDFIVFCNMRLKTIDIIEDLSDQMMTMNLDCLGKCLWLPSWPYPITH